MRHRARRRRRLPDLSRSRYERLVHRRRRRLKFRCQFPNSMTRLPNHSITKFFIVYIELHTASAFSFLQGASLPEALVDRAAALGYSAVALLDRDGVYGIPRFHKAARAAGIRPIVGAELTMRSGGSGESGQSGGSGRSG